MQHTIEIQDGVDGKVYVLCSCGKLMATAHDDIVRHTSAKKMAESIGQSHLVEMAVQDLIAKGDHVIMPKTPTNDDIVLLSYSYERATVQGIKDNYEIITKHGKELTKLLAPTQK
ncbi:hypothetical protein VPHK449_0049 [Vibrio phage K449]